MLLKRLFKKIRMEYSNQTAIYSVVHSTPVEARRGEQIVRDNQRDHIGVKLVQKGKSHI